MMLAEKVMPNPLGTMFTKDVVNLGKNILLEMMVVYETMERTAAYRNDYQSKVADIWERYQKLVKDAQEKVNSILRDATLGGVWFYDSGAPEMKGDYAAYVNKLPKEDLAMLDKLRKTYDA